MTDYPYPYWRRLPFAALLIVVLAIALVPPVSQGTVTVRVYGLASPGLVSHVYVRFSQVELHTAGFPPDSGWVTLREVFPSVDLIPRVDQFVPETVLSTSVQSGRYDAIRLAVSNSTVIINDRPMIPAPPSQVLSANVTVPVPPNGFGDILVVVTFDYSLLVANPPSLSIKILQITAL